MTFVKGVTRYGKRDDEKVCHIIRPESSGLQGEPPQTLCGAAIEWFSVVEITDPVCKECCRLSGRGRDSWPL